MLPVHKGNVNKAINNEEDIKSIHPAVEQGDLRIQKVYDDIDIPFGTAGIRT